MKWLFSPPSLDDFARLLKAWRFWSVGVRIGGLIGAAVYYAAPPPYRARATVLVDFNLEQAWPQETDRQQFYYLEREARRLEEIAWSDEVMQAVSSSQQIPVEQLHEHKLQLSQPAEAGWHFYVDDQDPKRAQDLAAKWALAFTEKARENVVQSQGLNRFIQVEATQVETLPRSRAGRGVRSR